MKTKKIIKISGSIVLVFTLLIASAAWYFSSQVLHPAPGKCDPKHFVYCGSPQELGLKFEAVRFFSDHPIEIKGWFVPADSKRAIILVHGITANRRESMRWLKALHQAGFNLLAIDLRNHGESSPSVTTLGWNEKNDVIKAVDFLINHKKMAQIGVLGVSMGASASIHAMAQDKRIIAGVFEASFVSARSLLEGIALRDYGLPPVLTIDLVNFFFQMRSRGISLNMIRPVDRIAQISPRPVFILHCPKDKLIPFENGERLFEAALKPKYFWASPCDKHARAWQGNPQLAERKVVNFFTTFMDSSK